MFRRAVTYFMVLQPRNVSESDKALPDHGLAQQAEHLAPQEVVASMRGMALLIAQSWLGPVHTPYTGIFLLDFPISVLVAFFFAATDGSHPDYQLFVMHAYSILQPAFVWLHAEQLRLSLQQISTK